MKGIALAAILFSPAGAFAQAAPAYQSQKDALAEAHRRLFKLIQDVEAEGKRAEEACDQQGFGHPSCGVGLELNVLGMRVRNAQIVASLSGDKPYALHCAEADLLELGWELASYHSLIGSHLEDGAAVESGEKALYTDAAGQASDLRSDLMAKYHGSDRFAVAIQPDGTGKLLLKVFVPKGAPPQVVSSAIQAGAAKRTLAVTVEDWPELRTK